MGVLLTDLRHHRHLDREPVERATLRYRQRVQPARLRGQLDPKRVRGQRAGERWRVEYPRVICCESARGDGSAACLGAHVLLSGLVIDGDGVHASAQRRKQGRNSKEGVEGHDSMDRRGELGERGGREREEEGSVAFRPGRRQLCNYVALLASRLVRSWSSGAKAERTLAVLHIRVHQEA